MLSVSQLFRMGLRLGEDGKRCVDIDECAEGTAPCDQECVNKDPRDSGLPYVCKCRGGYSIDIDNQHECIPQVRSHLEVALSGSTQRQALLPCARTQPVFLPSYTLSCCVPSASCVCLNTTCLLSRLAAAPHVLQIIQRGIVSLEGPSPSPHALLL